MPRQSLKAIEAQIRKLQAKAEAMRARDKKPAIESIVRIMREHEVTLAEVGEALGKRPRGRPAKSGGAAAKPAVRRRAKAVVKYRDPASGATWSGRGRAPRWIVEAEQAGRSRGEFAATAS